MFGGMYPVVYMEGWATMSDCKSVTISDIDQESEFTSV